MGLTEAIIASGVSIIIYVIVAQFAHQVHKRNRYLEAQIKLLSRIAEKQVVSKEEIEQIVKISATKEPGI